MNRAGARSSAEAFERVPWQAGTPTSGSIRHGKAATAAAQLLADWLGAKLQAKLQLDATGEPTAACPDAVVLRTGGFEVELQAPRQQIRVHVTTPEHCYLPFAMPFARGTDGDLLAAAIDQD